MASTDLIQQITDSQVKIEDFFQDLQAIQASMANTHSCDLKELYSKRGVILQKIPGFWYRVLTNSEVLSEYMLDEEKVCLESLTNFEIEIQPDSYTIKFTFDPSRNKYFTNTTLEKHSPIKFGNVGTSTKINWIPENSLLPELEKGELTFFNWLIHSKNPALDYIGLLLKREIWPDPFSYYMKTNEECDFAIPGQNDQEEGTMASAATTAAEESKKNGSSDDASTTISGLPRFWLTIFQNVSQFADMVEDHDIPILEHLEDIKVELTKEPMGFQLCFHFSPNEYFKNKVLTKTYEMRVQVDPKDPFAIEGTEFSKSVGCQIDWNEGKDVTVREVPTPSFFDFFSPPQVDQEKKEDVQEKLKVDFELGSFLKERIIPSAALYYTEALKSGGDEFKDEVEETGRDNAHAEEEQMEDEDVD